MSLVLQSSGGGQITIQEPATASNFTATLPAATGEVMVSGNMPAFSAYASSAQSFSNGTFAKVQINTENFDTNSNFDTTNYRFTPTVAGYYQFNIEISMSGSATGVVLASLYKNGSEYQRLGQCANNASNVISNGCTLVYANGTTDYFEFYSLQNSGVSLNNNAGSTSTLFSGFLARTA